MDLFLIILLAVATVMSTILSARAEVLDEKEAHKLWFSRIKKRGWWLIFFQTLILVVAIASYFRSESKEIALKNETRNRDSTVKAEVRKGMQSVYMDLSDAFLKNRLQVDTLSNSIRLLRDSPSVVTTEAKLKRPLLLIDANGVKSQVIKDSLGMDINLTAKEGGVYNASISFLALIVYVDGTAEYTSPLKLATGRKNIPENASTEYRVLIHTRGKLHSEVYFSLDMKYEDGNGKQYTLRSVYLFDKEKKTSELLEKVQEEFYSNYEKYLKTRSVETPGL